MDIRILHAVKIYAIDLLFVGFGGWCNVGLLLMQCWVMVGTTWGDGWCNSGSRLVQCWVMVGAMLGHGWCNVG